MSKISEAFKTKKTLIPFLTAGDPDIATTKEIIRKMIEAGAGIIEIGIPFSDPIAEGPVIAAANERALSVGTTTDDVFEMVKELSKETEVPFIFLTYINPIYTYGKDKFFARCKECGISGVIVPDLPYEERAEIADECAKYDIERISLIAPTSNERIAMLASEAVGYVYCVSSMGVTGTRTTFSSNIEEVVAEIKKNTKTPVAIGFGIADAEAASKMAGISDGAIIGSAIVKIIGANGKNAPEKVYEFLKGITDYDQEFVK